MGEILTGRIKCTKQGGFGFIVPDIKGPDVFFHISKLADGVDFNELKPGQNVEYEEFASHKGLNAMNVRPVTYTT